MLSRSRRLQSSFFRSPRYGTITVNSPKLLRALQEREFERLGSTHTRKVNVRLVAATHRDLEKLIAERDFRSDLAQGRHSFAGALLRTKTIETNAKEH